MKTKKTESWINFFDLIRGKRTYVIAVYFHASKEEYEDYCKAKKDYLYTKADN